MCFKKLHTTIMILMLVIGYFNIFDALYAKSLTSGNNSVNYTEIDVIVNNLGLTKDSVFNTPAIEQKVDLMNSSGTLNNSLKDIVKKVSVLQVSGGPRRVAQSFTMRGFDKSGIVVLIDGLPVSFLSQHVNFLPISLMPVSSINVISGPFSSIYGSNALAGVVSLTTVSPTDLLSEDKVKGMDISTSYASAKSKFNIMGTAYNINTASDTLLSISYMNSKNVKTGDYNKVKVSELDEQVSGMLKNRYYFNNQMLSLAYYFNLDDVTVPVNPEQNNNSNSRVKNIDHNIKLQNHTLKVAHEFNRNNINFWPSMETLIYINYAKHEENPQEDFPAPPKTQPFYKKGENLGKTNYSLGSFHKESFDFVLSNNIWTSLVYGTDYKFQDQKRNSKDPRGLVANASSHNLGLFLQDELFLSNYITLLGALRYDYFDIKSKGEHYINTSSTVNQAKSKTYNQLSPKTSLTIKPSSNIMMYTSYGRAFKTPNLNEVHASGLHFQSGKISNILLPNPNLKPTTADTAEVGYGFNFKDILTQNSTFNFKNAFYYTYAKDFITLFVTRTTSQYINVSKVKMRGLDLVVNYESNSLNSSFTYNYIHAIDADKNIGLLNISNHTFKYNCEYNLPTRLNWFLGSNLLAQSSFFIYAPNSTGTHYTNIQMPGFATLDIYTGIKSKKYRFYVGVDNLLDKFYYDTFAILPAPGRSYKVLLTVKL